jgi:hypothetical protein
MKRTTIMLPERLKAKAERRARTQGISLSELIRESLAKSLAHSKTRESDQDPFLTDDATFVGGPRDLARNHDRYLYGDKSDFR